MSATAIKSARQVAARIEGSRIVPAQAPTLPVRILGLGGFAKVPHVDGRVALFDRTGGPCGVFTNGALADACITALTR